MKKKSIIVAVAIAFTAIVGSVAISNKAVAKGDYGPGNCYLNMGGGNCPQSPLANCTCY